MKHSSRLSVRYEHDESGPDRGDTLAGAIADGLRQAALPGVSPLSENALVAALRAQHALLAAGAGSDQDDEEISERQQRRRRDRGALREARPSRLGGRKLEMDTVLAATLLLGSATVTDDGQLAGTPPVEGQAGRAGSDGIDPLPTGSGRRPVPREGGPDGSGSEPTGGHAGEGLLAAAFLPLGARSITPETPLSFEYQDPAFLLAGQGHGGSGPPAGTGMPSDSASQVNTGPNALSANGGSGPAAPAFLTMDDWPRPARPAGSVDATPTAEPPAPVPPVAVPVAPSSPVPPATPAPAVHVGRGLTLGESGGQAGPTPFGAAIDEQDALLVTVSNGTLVSARLRLASEGVFSGLFTTDGAAIHLYSDGANRVVGRTLQGRTVLVVTSDDGGHVSASLLAPLRHGAPNSATDDLVSLDDDVLSLDFSLRGLDGHVEQGSIDIGQRIDIEDSTFSPSPTPGLVPPTEDGVTIRFDTQQVPAGFLFVENANGTLAIYQQQQGMDVLVRELAWNGDHLAVTEIAPIVTPLGQGLQDLALPVHYSLVDGDGDRLDILTTLVVTDRMPETAAVDEVMSNRQTVETVRGHALASPDGITAFNWRTNGAPQGTTYVIDPADPTGLTLLVQQGGVTRIVARLDAATGDYTVTRLAPLEHGTMQSLILDLTYEVTDRDGDTAVGHLNIQVDDTAPLLNNPTLSIQERFGTQTVTAQAFSAPDGLQAASWTLPATVPSGFQYALDPADASGGTLIVRQLQNNIWVTVLGLVLDRQTGEIRATQVAQLLEDGSNGGQSALSFDYGVRDTDGDLTTGTVTLQVDRLGIVARNITVTSTESDAAQHIQTRAFTPSANLADVQWLTAGAPQGFVYEADPADASGRTLLIRQGNLVVATLVIDAATGNILIDHDTAFAHAPGNGANRQIFDLGYRLSDANGGRQDYQLRFSITDSTPQVETVSIAFAESDQMRVLRGDAFSAVDGIQSARWQTGGAPPGITYVLDPSDPAGTTLLIQQGGVTRMVAVLDRSTGTYALTTHCVLDHQGQDLVFDLAYDVTDGDGDSVTGHLVFTVEDSAAFVTATNITIAETAIGTRYLIGRATGADGIASVSWSTTGAPAGFLYRANGNELSVRQVQNGVEVTVMTFVYDSATGQISAINRAAIDHLADGLSQRFTATINVTDGDGTTTRALVSTTVTDSQPSAPTLSNLPSTLMDGQTHDGRWTGHTSGDRSVLEIEIGTQIRQLDLSSPTNVLTFTDNGLTYTFRADGTYRIVCDPTRDFTLQMTLRIRDRDGDVAAQQYNRAVEFVSTAPVAFNAGFNVLTRADYVVRLSDFNFVDAEGHALRHVTLVGPINNGAVFLLNGVQIGAGTVITAADIANGNLVIRFPANMAVGSLYAASFTLTDDGGTDHGGADTSGRMMMTFGVPHTWQDSGTSQNDTYAGGIPEDTYYGFGGNDTISGSEGNDTLYGGSGDDVITGSSGNDTLYGEAGNDDVRGGDGNDDISGGSDDDILYGNGGNDLIHGDSGDDTIYGSTGDDELDGDSGNDSLYGGSGDDEIAGGDGNDTIYGDSGRNNLYGQDGNDTLYAGTGTNLLAGGSGDDLLFGGSGFNMFRGGSGADLFIMNASRLSVGYDQIEDYSSAEGDIIDLTALFTADAGTRFLERDGYVRSTISPRGYYVLWVSPNHDGRFEEVAIADGDTADERVRVSFKDRDGNILFDWI